MPIQLKAFMGGCTGYFRLAIERYRVNEDTEERPNMWKCSSQRWTRKDVFVGQTVEAKITRFFFYFFLRIGAKEEMR